MSSRLYDPEYESELIRGIDTPRPWNITKKISALIKPSHHLLDIGCGTAAKTLPFAPYVATLTGVEPSYPMRQRARSHIARERLRNVNIINGEAQLLPVTGTYFNGVINLLAPDDPEEIYRVLVPGGFAVLEKIGERDKAELKRFFGNDEQGSRGQFSELQPGERLADYRARYGQRFLLEEAQTGTWETFYSFAGLKKLLLHTPTIRNFDLKKDIDCLTRAAAALMTPRGICVQQQRILIIVRKP